MDNIREARGRRRSGRLVAASLAAMLVFGACGDDSGGGGGDADIVTLLQGEGESQASAECLAEALSDFSTDELTAFVNGEGDNEDLAAQVASAKEACAEQVGE